MRQFATGFALGTLGAIILGSSLAGANRPQFRPPTADQVGLPDGRGFVVVCTDTQGFYDGTKRLTVSRTAGDQNSPDALLQCRTR